MKIKFYGSSHGLPERDRFCTSVLIEAEKNHYMVDAGAPIADLLIRDGLKLEDVKAMFITHLHGDHVDGLPQYFDLATWAYTDTDPEIFTPSLYLKDAVDAWIKLEFRNPPREFKYREISEGEIYSDGVIKVRAYRTAHMRDTHPGHERYSYGFAIDEVATGKKILFTGDLTSEMSDFPVVAFDEHFDTVVLEGAHTPLHECMGVLKKCKTDCFIVGHVNPEVVTGESVETVRSELNVPVTVACDMAEYII
ncbi:MAG: MBL fold metallo-hydrolase [Oscillospiraceae bacterium]|nr:MBL fold metallo-hydrolase [Oscillospiraceae bacterium]